MGGLYLSILRGAIWLIVIISHIKEEVYLERIVPKSSEGDHLAEYIFKPGKL